MPTHHGTAGNDAIDLRAETSGYTIYGYGGRARILGTGYDDLVYGGDDRDTLHGMGGEDRLGGGGANDEMLGWSGEDLLGEDGDDIMYGDEGDDSLIGTPSELIQMPRFTQGSGFAATLGYGPKPLRGFLSCASPSPTGECR